MHAAQFLAVHVVEVVVVSAMEGVVVVVANNILSEWKIM